MANCLLEVKRHNLLLKYSYTFI